MGTVEGTRAQKTWVGEYDFAIDGGAISTIPLRSNDGPIPSGSYISQSVVDVLTLFTTGTAATAALTIEAAGDVVAATVVSGAPYSTTGLKSTVQVGTGATMIKTTAARSPSIVIATGTVTAGKLRLILEYR
jgi:hypothetical protein